LVTLNQWHCMYPAGNQFIDAIEGAAADKEMLWVLILMSFC